MTDERSASDVAVDSTEVGAAADSRTGFGARLAAEREQRALSQADVARALNLRVAVIVAVEEEDFAALPKMTFVRGYARSYARLLGVDEADIAEALAAWRDPGEDGRLPLSPASVRPKRRLGSSLHGHAGLILTVLSLLLALALAAGLVMIWPDDGFSAMDSGSAVEPSVPPPAARPVAPGAPAAAIRRQVEGLVMPEAVEGEGGSEDRDDLFADDAYDGSEAAEEAEQHRQHEARQIPMAAATATASAPDEVAEFSVRRERVEDGGVLRVVAPGEDHLLLRFSGDCWVEIRDAEGRGVVSDLAREGQTFEVHGQGPFRMLLGYAHGVELVYNGEPVALARHIRNDVASLVVGR